MFDILMRATGGLFSSEEDEGFIVTVDVTVSDHSLLLSLTLNDTVCVPIDKSDL